MTLTHILLIIIIILLLLGRKNSLIAIQYIIGTAFLVFAGYVLITTPELEAAKEIVIWIVSVFIGISILLSIMWRYEKMNETLITADPPKVLIWIFWIGIAPTVWGTHTILIWLIP